MFPADSVESAQREISFFFPDFSMEEWLEKEEPSFRSGQILYDHQRLIHTLECKADLGTAVSVTDAWGLFRNSEIHSPRGHATSHTWSSTVWSQKSACFLLVTGAPTSAIKTFPTNVSLICSFNVRALFAFGEFIVNFFLKKKGWTFLTPKARIHIFLLTCTYCL